MPACTSARRNIKRAPRVLQSPDGEARKRKDQQRHRKKLSETEGERKGEMSSTKAIPANHRSLLPRSQLSTGKIRESVCFANFPTAEFSPAQSKQLFVVRGGGGKKQDGNRASSVGATFEDRAVETEGLSFYELLGIPETVGISEIKQAYKQLARKYHPDVSPPDRSRENTKRFILVQEAYETLSDPRLRAMYDRDLARGMHVAFSARRRFDEEYAVKSEWKHVWEDQLSELKRRSEYKNSEANMSWGARMRRQRDQLAEEQ